VEETAYAPMLRKLAEEGMDVYLVAMPQRLAFFGIQRATEVFTEKLVDPDDLTVWTQARERYGHFYIGGHSLGGAMAANYAAKHPDKIEGLVLLAAYSSKPLPEDLSVLSVYGSEDGVLNRNKYEENRANLPADYQEIEIAGGNHAQFGSYGKQRGDGAASISAEEQQKATVDAILSFWEAE
ncbi:MAG: alpha/beta fold hydrolase, partial [Firmicutes bacterium]|nr:alpha/beta fold hydrolase [Bacillota bacterium]